MVKKLNRNKKKKENLKSNEKLYLSKIQKKIISFVQKNKLLLNNSFSSERLINSNKELINKILSSCLCQISDFFGSAVCINEKGYILTCAHAAPPFEDDNTKESLYIFPSGEIIKALTLDKDEKIDLALLQIISVFKNNKFINIKNLTNKKFPYAKIKIPLNSKNESKGKNVFCIGNPCFTMEDDDGKIENNDYKPFWISFGKIKGYLKDPIFCKDDLGPLIHNCWTYWGHSGAPIFNFDGELVGMHNSWNEKNANRHGNSLLGIIKFLSKFDFLN